MSMTINEKKQRLKELELKAKILKREADYYNARQLALKLVLNGSYGAFAARYFIMFNNNVAGTITAQGRELTQTMDRVAQEYWHEIWHNDTELHKKLFIKNVKEMDKNEPASIYGDSVCGSSMIRTDIGELSIEDLYNMYNIKSIRKDKEVIPVDFKALNWTEENNIHYSKVKNIIRHKVSKKKWKLKVDGKELILTNDHSLIVFRNGKKMEVKPKDVLKTDKILIYTYGDTESNSRI